MKKVLLVLALLVAILILGVRYFMPPQDQDARPEERENVVLQLRLDGTQCMLQVRTPPAVRARWGATVTWTLAGNCGENHTVAINEQFRDLDTGTSVDIIESGELRQPAVAGRQLRATLQGGTEEKQYRYEVLIDGKPAQYASPANHGDLFACPDWPCPRYY